MDTEKTARVADWGDSKVVTAFEVGAVACFIAFQNFYSIFPINEVPYVFLYGWIRLRLRGQRWSSVGLCRPESWLKTVSVGLAAGIFLQLLSEFITEPAIAYLTGQPVDLSDFRPLVGNTKLLLIYFAAIWTLAAFGEEMVYRGYIMNRVADFGDRTTLAWGVSAIVVSIFFGIGHYYQGISGMIGSGISSLIFAGVYFLLNRNIWVAVLAHGFSNSIGLFIIYFGLHEV